MKLDMVYKIEILGINNYHLNSLRSRLGLICTSGENNVEISVYGSLFVYNL